MVRYLVTGGCGFIGSHLCDALLARGDHVIVLDDLSTGKRDNLAAGADLVVGSAANAALVRTLMAEVDGCFHLAAIASVQRSNEDWLGTHSANLTATITVLDAARGHRGMPPVPVVYASSAAVYGAGGAHQLCEDAATMPLSAYGADKLGCELHAAVAAKVHGVPAVGLRFFNVYGPRQDPSSPYSGVISIFADRLRAGGPLTIHGDGLQVRDFIYVGDVVRFLLAAEARAPHLRGRVFNVCTGSAASILEMAEMIGETLAVRPQLAYQPARLGDVRVSLGNPTLAADLLGLRAQCGLREGLRETLHATIPAQRRRIGNRGAILTP